jgi:hypothetical protein
MRLRWTSRFYGISPVLILVLLVAIGRSGGCRAARGDEVVLGTNKIFDRGFLNFFIAPTDPAAASLLSPGPPGTDASRDLIGNALKVFAGTTGEGLDTEGQSVEITAAQVFGTTFTVAGSGGASRQARVEFLFDYDVFCFVSGDRNTTATALYDVTSTVVEGTAINPLPVVATDATIGALPIRASIVGGGQDPKPGSERDLIIDTSAVLREGRMYTAVIQARATVQLNGRGSTLADGSTDSRQLTLKEIRVVFP